MSNNVDDLRSALEFLRGIPGQLVETDDAIAGWPWKRSVRTIPKPCLRISASWL